MANLPKETSEVYDLDKFFIVFSFSGFSPVFGHPEFCLFWKKPGRNSPRLADFFWRGATVSQHLRRLWSLQLCGRSDVPSVKVRGGTLGRLFSVVATQIFLIFTPKLGEMIHFDSYFSDGLKPPTSGASKTSLRDRFDGG